MDRFIVLKVIMLHHLKVNLKSNMDRFIAAKQLEDAVLTEYLKSNMDRFIEVLRNRPVSCLFI